MKVCRPHQQSVAVVQAREGAGEDSRSRETRGDMGNGWKRESVGLRGEKALRTHLIKGLPRRHSDSFSSLMW